MFYCLVKSKMIKQYKTVIKLTFTSPLIINLNLKSQQLALPKDDVIMIRNKGSLLFGFLNRGVNSHLSSRANNNISVRRSIHNNIIMKYLLLNKISLLSLYNIGFLNSQSHPASEFKRRKFF